MEEAARLTPCNTHFLVVSFEGPDRYSTGGGLGIRVTQLVRTLARKRFPTQLVFVGDPRLPRREYRMDGRLTLHRWSQWISRRYPDGVYHGEESKLYDFNETLPRFILEEIARPAIAVGKMLVVLGEEWQTAELMCRLSDLLYHNGLRDRAVLFWNASSTMSFHRIDWGRLAFTTTITTVSKYMKHLMWGMGVNAQVIPSGIPSSMFRKVDGRDVDRVRDGLGKDFILYKFGSWDPGKGWNAAMEATATLKGAGLRVVLLARAGAEPHGEWFLHHAGRLGLRVSEVCPGGKGHEAWLSAIAQACDGDIVNICSELSPDLLRVLCRASDAVLTNGGREPSGLAGLEAMASGGIAFAGASGEDYAIHKRNSLVQQTGDSWEIVSNLLYLRDHPEEERRIRRAARRSARSFTWEKVAENLVSKVEQQARAQGILCRATLIKPQPPDHAAPVFDGKAV